MNNFDIFQTELIIDKKISELNEEIVTLLSFDENAIRERIIWAEFMNYNKKILQLLRHINLAIDKALLSKLWIDFNKSFLNKLSDKLIEICNIRCETIGRSCILPLELQFIKNIMAESIDKKIDDVLQQTDDLLQQKIMKK